MIAGDRVLFNFLQAFDDFVELMVDLADFRSKLVLAARQRI